ncbi:Glycoside hydrolase, family 35 [Corchorus capsularis]|uniref:Glycoside hydrolase, family 35 n=1 Tax=Corchorus capsularis TaxID=210143 RepID=A0A1R3IY29_COCAP|nr:Glycoside hydrolase, family 35 [Corchorus capsularis]
MLSTFSCPFLNYVYLATHSKVFSLNSELHLATDKFPCLGLLRQPKYGHLKELHKAIKLCEHALVSSDPTVTSLGTYEQAHVFSSRQGGCAAFLANYHTNSAATVMFNNRRYNLPPWSISILPDCKNVVFNTATVGVKTSQVQMLPTNSKMFSWETYDEDISSLGESSRIVAPGLLEQINVTRDTSDYLWYTTSVDINPSELRGGQKPTLNVNSAGHALHVFVNGEFSGSAFGTRENRRFTFSGPANLRGGTNRIALLSVAVGLPVGLRGEAMNLISPHGTSSAEWTRSSLATRSRQSMTWYKVKELKGQGVEKGMNKGIFRNFGTLNDVMC